MKLCSALADIIDTISSKKRLNTILDFVQMDGKTTFCAFSICINYCPHSKQIEEVIQLVGRSYDEHESMCIWNVNCMACNNVYLNYLIRLRGRA